MSSQTYNPHTQRMLRDVIYFKTNYNWLYGDMFAESNTSVSKTPKWNFELSDLPVFFPTTAVQVLPRYSLLPIEEKAY